MPKQESGSRSRSVPDVKPTSVRLDDDTLAFVEREAKRLGMSASEVIRRSVQFQLAWRMALEAIKAGADPEAVEDPAEVARLLAKHRPKE